MNGEISKCVDARVNFLDEYYIIPIDMKDKVEEFIAQIKELGESCKDVEEFEKNFISTGLSDNFNSILQKCSPKPVKMTKEQKKQSLKTATNIINDNKKEIINDSINQIGQSVFNNLKEDAIDKNRKRMIANDTFDDYSRASNSISGGGLVIEFFRKIFGKK